MVIAQIEPQEVLTLSRQAVALPDAAPDIQDEALLSALVRRAAGILCPCAASTLARAVLESLQYLAEHSAQLEEDIDAAIEGAMTAGDLLELSQVTTDDPAAKGTWVFAAPPAFVARETGAVFLVGLTPDEPTPLPPYLSVRIEYQRHYRIIRPRPSENLALTLSELGLLELSERNWLKLPKEETASGFRERLERQLNAQPPSGEVLDLLILDSERDPGYYRGRWTAPKRVTGVFVARRPQAYGAPIWGLALLADGALGKFLDFPLKGAKWRGSDFAWHVQMAIDHCRGLPQSYRRRIVPGGACLDFFSPLPLWAERRLAIVGKSADRYRSLFSYQVPEADLNAEEAFLQKRLWLARKDDPQERI